MTSTHLLLCPILEYCAKYRGMEVDGGGWRVEGRERYHEKKEMVQLSRVHNLAGSTTPYD